jgi:hypothetical protein
MPQSHLDHGVAGGAHWLLDEELAVRSGIRRTRANLPVLLRHDEALLVSQVPSAEPDSEPTRRSSLFFLAGLVAALSLYPLFRGADIGAGEPLPARASQDEGVVVTATFADEPRAGQITTIRASLGDARPVSAATRQPRTAEPGKPAAAKQPEQPKPPPPPDALLPPLPPPPAPLPLPDPLREVPPLPEVPLLPVPETPTVLGDL